MNKTKKEKKKEPGETCHIKCQSKSAIPGYRSLCLLNESAIGFQKPINRLNKLT